MRIPVEPVLRHADDRGVLVKAWPRPTGGEVYVVELRPGTSRGHHLHRRGGEWFVPLAGEVLLVVVDPASGERARQRLAGVRARVEPGQAHALFNVGPAVGWVLAVADLGPAEDETVPFDVPGPGAP